MIDLCLCLVYSYVYFCVFYFNVSISMLMCVMFRVSLVFRSSSSVVSVCVYFCVSVYWGFPVLVCLGS